MYQVGNDPLNSATFRSSSRPLDWGTSLQGTSPATPPAADSVQPFPGPGTPGGPNAQSGLSGFFGGLGNYFGNLFSWLSNAMNALANSSAQTAGPEQSFLNASLSSWGDPHLSLSGTTGGGRSVGSNWDSMAAHGNLLSSDSFSGGLQISNQVSAASSTGATLNSQVTVSTNGGATQVSLDNAGNALLTNGGRQTTLQRGNQYAAGNGEMVTENADGSLTIADSNGSGGALTATLKLNGAGGVDLSATASNIDLGGYLITKNDDPGIIDAQGATAAGLPNSLGPIEYQPVAPAPYTSVPAYQPQTYQTQAAQGQNGVGDLSSLVEDADG